MLRRGGREVFEELHMLPRSPLTKCASCQEPIAVDAGAIRRGLRFFHTYCAEGAQHSGPADSPFRDTTATGIIVATIAGRPTCLHCIAARIQASRQHARRLLARMGTLLLHVRDEQAACSTCAKVSRVYLLED